MITEEKGDYLCLSKCYIFIFCLPLIISPLDVTLKPTVKNACRFKVALVFHLMVLIVLLVACVASSLKTFSCFFFQLQLSKAQWYSYAAGTRLLCRLFTFYFCYFVLCLNLAECTWQCYFCLLENKLDHENSGGTKCVIYGIHPLSLNFVALTAHWSYNMYGFKMCTFILY